MMLVRWLTSSLILSLLMGVSARGEDKKPPEKSGTVYGLVTAKDKSWIEVKGDGEEKARRYVPRWVSTGAGQGGLDKNTLQAIADVKLGSRVRIEWEFDERARVVKLEVVKAPAKNKPKKP